jgi:type IV fimbrial biogenesis protein FimT
MNIPPSIRRKSKKVHSFTLVELMAVMAIAGILALLSLIAYTQIIRSESLTTSAQVLTGALEMARQNAITLDCDVEFRLYRIPSAESANPTTDPLSTTGYRAFQTFAITPTATNALNQVSFLSGPVYISNTGAVSSLATNSTELAGTALQSIPTYGQNYSAEVFDFSPSGGLELPMSSQWYLTMELNGDVTTGTPPLPKNFAAIQLDPFTGKPQTYRP